MSKIFHYCKRCGAFIEVKREFPKRNQAKVKRLNYCKYCKEIIKNIKNKIDYWFNK